MNATYLLYRHIFWSQTEKCNFQVSPFIVSFIISVPTSLANSPRFWMGFPSSAPVSVIRFLFNRVSFSFPVLGALLFLILLPFVNSKRTYLSPVKYLKRSDPTSLSPKVHTGLFLTRWTVLVYSSHCWHLCGLCSANSLALTPAIPCPIMSSLWSSKNIFLGLAAKELSVLLRLSEDLQALGANGYSYCFISSSFHHFCEAAEWQCRKVLDSMSWGYEQR